MDLTIKSIEKCNLSYKLMTSFFKLYFEFVLFYYIDEYNCMETKFF
jgi:hypothetical protein